MKASQSKNDDGLIYVVRRRAMGRNGRAMLTTRTIAASASPSRRLCPSCLAQVSRAGGKKPKGATAVWLSTIGRFARQSGPLVVASVDPKTDQSNGESGTLPDAPRRSTDAGPDVRQLRFSTPVI
uniref:Uncharacterized protein n=1 Tax=Plectus sambesii TaxID=2011161 RepID=A0A914VUE5_9BILA